MTSSPGVVFACVIAQRSEPASVSSASRVTVRVEGTSRVSRSSTRGRKDFLRTRRGGRRAFRFMADSSQRMRKVGIRKIMSVQEVRPPGDAIQGGNQIRCEGHETDPARKNAQQERRRLSLHRFRKAR